MLFEIIMTICFFIIGASITSFFQCAFYRKINGPGAFGEKRSFCENCGHRLGVIDLIPVFGWLLLKGKCRYCGSRIPGRYPLAEAIGGLSFSALFFVSGLSVKTLFGAALCTLLIAISLYDVDTRRIPNVMNLLLFIVAAVYVICGGLTRRGLISSLAGGLVIPALIMLLAFLMEKKTGRQALGCGDLKMLAGTGLLLGTGLSILNILFMSLFGLVYAAVRRKKKTDAFAFAPFISASTFVLYLFGRQIGGVFFGDVWSSL